MGHLPRVNRYAICSSTPDLGQLEQSEQLRMGQNLHKNHSHCDMKVNSRGAAGVRIASVSSYAIGKWISPLGPMWAVDLVSPCQW